MLKSYFRNGSAIRLYKAKDLSRLQKKTIVNKDGKKQTVYVRSGEEVKQERPKQASPEGVQEGRKPLSTLGPDGVKKVRDVLKRVLNIITAPYLGNPVATAGEEADRVGGDVIEAARRRKGNNDIRKEQQKKKQESANKSIDHESDLYSQQRELLKDIVGE